MKSHRVSRRFAAAVLALNLCAASHGQVTTVASDSFNYGPGSLNGANGGTGWTGYWTNDYASGASFDVSASGMSYAGLSAAGGSLVWAPGGNNISEDSRLLPLMSAGIVYLQFLSQFGSSSGGGTPNIRLLDSGALTGGFGANGGTNGGVFSILNTSLQPAPDGSSYTSASLAATNLIVARIDYLNDNTKMWVNPNLSLFDYLNPSAPDATYSGLAPVFNQIAIFSRSPANVDELTVMTAPEPSVGALLIVGLTGVLCVQTYRRPR